MFLKDSETEFYFGVNPIQIINLPKIEKYNLTIQGAANILRWHDDYENTKDMFMDMWGLKDEPKCICGEKRKFISISMGFFPFCSSEKHKKEIVEYSHIKRNNTIKGIKLKYLDLDKHILQNLDFYKEKCEKFPESYFDTFLNRDIRSYRHLKSFSLSKLFLIESVCVVCGNKTKNPLNSKEVKFVCSKKSCASTYSNFKFHEKKYSFEDFSNHLQSKQFIHDKNTQIWCGVTLKKESKDATFSAFKNNLFYLCDIDECRVCGSFFLKNDLVIRTDGSTYLRRVGAKYSCSLNCYNKIRGSEIWFKRSEESRAKQSNNLKQLISKGIFSPCVTNSWANSRIYLDKQAFRSTWEAYFYLFNKNILNKSLQYETLIIPYLFENKERNYIVDFIDTEDKIVYEVKPDGMKEEQKNIKKAEALIKWCEENDYIFKYIDEFWIKENFKVELIYNIQDEEYRNKMLRNLKGFL